MIGYGVCVGDWDRLQKNVVPHLNHRPLTALSGQHSISTAYNTILDSYVGHGLDALVLQHDDLEINDPLAESKIYHAINQDDVAYVSVIGSQSQVPSLSWWDGQCIGHQATDTMLIDFGKREGDAVMTDGSIMIFSRWAIKNLRFDEEFHGFHGYDCDIGLTATQIFGKRVLVIDMETIHHTVPGEFKSDDSARQWRMATWQFQQKWGLT